MRRPRLAHAALTTFASRQQASASSPAVKTSPARRIGPSGLVLLACVALARPASAAPARPRRAVKTNQRRRATRSRRSAPDSPRAAVAAFLELCDRGRYEDAARYLELPRAEAKSGPELARRLDAVLDRRVLLDLDSISSLSTGNAEDKLPKGVDQIAEISVDDGEPEPVRLVRRRRPEAAWVFARETVERIDDWYIGLEDRWLIENLPAPLLRMGPRGLLWWQWIALPVVLFVRVDRRLGVDTRHSPRRPPAARPRALDSRRARAAAVVGAAHLVLGARARLVRAAVRAPVAACGGLRRTRHLGRLPAGAVLGAVPARRHRAAARRSLAVGPHPRDGARSVAARGARGEGDAVRDRDRRPPRAARVSDREPARRARDRRSRARTRGAEDGGESVRHVLDRRGSAVPRGRHRAHRELHRDGGVHRLAFHAIPHTRAHVDHDPERQARRDAARVARGARPSALRGDRWRSCSRRPRRRCGTSSRAASACSARPPEDSRRDVRDRALRRDRAVVARHRGERVRSRRPSGTSSSRSARMCCSRCAAWWRPRARRSRTRRDGARGRRNGRKNRLRTSHRDAETSDRAHEGPDYLADLQRSVGTDLAAASERDRGSVALRIADRRRDELARASTEPQWEPVPSVDPRRRASSRRPSTRRGRLRRPHPLVRSTASSGSAPACRRGCLRHAPPRAPARHARSWRGAASPPPRCSRRGTSRCHRRSSYARRRRSPPPSRTRHRIGSERSGAWWHVCVIWLATSAVDFPLRCASSSRSGLPCPRTRRTDPRSVSARRSRALRQQARRSRVWRAAAAEPEQADDGDDDADAHARRILHPSDHSGASQRSGPCSTPRSLPSADTSTWPPVANAIGLPFTWPSALSSRSRTRCCVCRRRPTR